jgi:hypothetical protein
MPGYHQYIKDCEKVFKWEEKERKIKKAVFSG